MATGGSEAFEEYVAARYSRLVRTAYLLTGQQQDAEDLVQNALVKVAAAWARVSDPDAYVRTVLVRENVSRWRRRRWREQSTDVVPEAEASPIDPTERIALRDALTLLAPRQRAVIVLRYYEDLTEAQTAEALGIAVGTVKSQARDALGRLRLAFPDLAEDLVSP